MHLRSLITLLAFISITFVLQSCASGSSASQSLSFEELEKSHEIISSGKSNQEYIDAIEVWGGKTFGSWQMVRQTVIKDKGIIVFRYRQDCKLVLVDPSTLMPNPVEKGVTVAVEVKRINEDKLSVTFSHISTECLIKRSLANRMKLNFDTMVAEIEQAIAEF